MDHARLFKVVLSFKFKSHCGAYAVDDLKATVRRACEGAKKQLNNRWENLSITTQFRPYQTGAPLNTQIVDLFTKADIGIFELSDQSPNVLYETGLFTGRGLRPILIRHRERGQSPPSDLQGLLYLEYSSYQELEKHLIDQIGRRIHDRMSNPDPIPQWISPLFHLPWFENDMGTSPLIILCGFVPSNALAALRKAKHPDLESQIMHFSDKDSLLEVTKILSTLYPQREQRRYNSSQVADMRYDLRDSLVSLGGPDFNSFYRNIEEMIDLPWKFESDSSSDAVLIDKRTGRRYEAERDRDRLPVSDYGIYLRLQNPFSPAKEALVFSGMTSLGTFGAVSAFAPSSEREENARYLANLIEDRREFGVLVKSERILNTQLVDSKVEWDTAWQASRNER